MNYIRLYTQTLPTSESVLMDNNADVLIRDVGYTYYYIYIYI